MATANDTQKRCCECQIAAPSVTCAGCNKSFCSTHHTAHRQGLSDDMKIIEEEHASFKQTDLKKSLFDQLNIWEDESIKKIQESANAARADLLQLIKLLHQPMSVQMDELSKEFCSTRKNNSFTEIDLKRWRKLLEECRKELEKPIGIKILKDDSPPIQLIKIESHEKTETNKINSSPQQRVRFAEIPSQADLHGSSPQNSPSTINKSGSSAILSASLPAQSSSYLSITFGLNQAKDDDIQRLFDHLMTLRPMDKNGPMKGKCGPQTDQMEQFLSQTFGFKNIPGKSIVQGVKSFELGKSLRTMDPNTAIYFPSNTNKLFAMTVQEILNWQRSYAVYAARRIKGMNEDFLLQALQGRSKDGEEAFRMKFVARISTCPILMEFDAEIISRKLDEPWPDKIKLVSVTGIDFAGRKHDVGDILYYVSNWKDVYEIDRNSGHPLLYNERDFQLRSNGPRGELREQRLLDDLMLMARIRLQACDVEGVQIVVETGIGLGVFAGERIGVDKKVRITSAIAIRMVLEQDGPRYKNIRGIVFALPIMDEGKHSKGLRDPFSDFIAEFENPQYNGPIPVMIADQDMHRLTVAIARHGFTVSELNPADSHGVFGEYWQNRGPAVEERLALTTAGLLVQHHLFNPSVLDSTKYHFV